ncbi:MAG: hypothetical protein HDR01_02700 [Lachnospiraceae bacterium]|nr:hypothetical protein [Lachnospiraceae bacterium]
MKRSLCTVLMAVFLLAACSACGRNASDQYDEGYQKGYEDGRTSVNKELTGNAVICGSFTATVREVIPDYVLDDTTPQVAVVTLFQESPFTIFVGEELGKTLETGQIYTFEVAEINVEEVRASHMEQTYLGPVTAISKYQLKIDSIRPVVKEEWGLECNRLSIEAK